MLSRKVKAYLILFSLVTLLLGVFPLGKGAYAASIFTDNFEDGNAAGWTASSGTWAVVSDGSYTYKQSNTNSTAEGVVCGKHELVELFGFSQYEVEYDECYWCIRCYCSLYGCQ